MAYIEELLRRQEQLWLDTLTGAKARGRRKGARAAGTGFPAAGVRRRTPAEPMAAWGGRAPASADFGEDGEAATAFSAGENEAEEWPLALAARRNFAPPRGAGADFLAGAESPQRTLGLPPLQTAREIAARDGRLRAGFFAAEEGASETAFPTKEAEKPPRAQESAAALSLAFERDARRYDSGFALY